MSRKILFSARCVFLATSAAAITLVGSFSLHGQTPSVSMPPDRPIAFKFSFGASIAPGFTQIDPAARYSPASPVGFENFGGAFPIFVAARSDNPLYSGWVTADAPFFFSANVPEGNYRVSITFDGDSMTTVKAELRRLMLEQISNYSGSHTTRTFAVNVHKPPILDATGKEISRVKVKAREVTRGGPWNGLNRTQGGEGFSWDDALSLEFSGKPAVSAVEITRDDSIHTIYICGDSTVCDQPAEPFTSWGQMITRWLKPEFSVANLAISGETAAAFYGENRMAKITSQLRPGDYVFVQFGHNDMKSTAANALASYKQLYTRFVTDTRAKGATPVLLTPVSRETFDADGKITNSFLTAKGDDYPNAVREVAREQNVTLIDLQSISAKFYEALGPGKSQVAFANASEKTHHSDYGSYEIAKCVLQGIVDTKLPLATGITEDFHPFDPNHPDDPADFLLPPDPFPSADRTPAGN